MPRFSDADAPIKKADMIPLMLEACPVLKPQWDEYLAERKDDADPPLYPFIDEIANHVVGLVDRGEYDDLAAIFDVVERWHLEGEHYVREAATIGFLEGIVSWEEKHREQQKVLESWFRPETARFWVKLHNFWSTGTIITED